MKPRKTYQVARSYDRPTVSDDRSTEKSAGQKSNHMTAKPFPMIDHLTDIAIGRIMTYRASHALLDIDSITASRHTRFICGDEAVDVSLPPQLRFRWAAAGRYRTEVPVLGRQTVEICPEEEEGEDTGRISEEYTSTYRDFSFKISFLIRKVLKNISLLVRNSFKIIFLIRKVLKNIFLLVRNSFKISFLIRKVLKNISLLVRNSFKISFLIRKVLKNISLLVRN